MKIGILTFHRALNYGAVLQCYALSEVLKGMGHDVEVIDYRPAYIEKYRKLFYWNDFKKKNLISQLKYLLTRPIVYSSKRKAAEAFDCFLNQHLRFSSPVYSVRDIPSCYDVIVFGSDQIWSPRICEGFDPLFWGKCPKGKAHFVAYAPSLEGYQNFTEQEWGFVLEALNNFDHISVREEAFKVELEKQTTKKISWVLDPTLLVNPDILKKCIKKPAIDKYIFLFTVQPGSLPYEIARQVAQEKGWKIVRARATKSMSKETGVIHLDACSPEEFLGLIYYAECVVTNSFHATALSIQLGKKIFSAKSERPKRVLNILNALGIQDRFVTEVKDVNVDSEMNYTTIREKLNNLASCSCEYVKYSLS